MKRQAQTATVTRDQPLSDLCREVYAEMKREPKRDAGNGKRRSVDVFSEADKAAQFRERSQGKPANDQAAEAAQPLTKLDDDYYAEIRDKKGGDDLTADAHARDRAHAQGEEIVRGFALDVRELGYTSPCWLWTRSKSGIGYGLLRWQGRTRGAHRHVFEMLRGPIPDGLVLDHLCRQRACCNPDHLEPVTNAENVRRGRPQHVTHCPRGHEYTPENTRVHRQKRKRGMDVEHVGRACRACQREIDVGRKRSGRPKRVSARAGRP